MERTPWWKLKRDALATAVWKQVDSLRSRSRTAAALDLTYEAYYRGKPLAGGRITTATPAKIDIARAKVEAVWSRMAQHRPFPVISCEDAGYSEKRFAVRCSRVLRSRLGQTALEKDKLLRIRDALVRGTAAAKIVRTKVGGKWDVGFERIPRGEILVSAREARYGCPRSMFHLKSYPLEVALAAFGKDGDDRKAIEAAASRANRDDDGYFIWGDEWADDTWQVPIVEAWHLPSSSDAGDGLRFLGVRNRTLAAEEWKRPRFPITLLHWSPPMRGMLDGDGLVALLMPIQEGINQTLRDAQEALYYGSQLKVFSPRQANINKEHLRARHPAVIEYDGQTPTYVAPDPVSPTLYSHMQWLLTMADDMSGLSRDFQSGTSQLSPDASGRAREVADDIQSDRFRAFQLFHSLDAVDTGTLMLDEARAIAEDDLANAAPWIKQHKWKKIAIDEGRYALVMEPINFLPQSRAGKMSLFEQLGKAGLIKDPDDVLEALSEEPDMARMNRRLLGPRHAIQHVLECLPDLDIPLWELTPDPFFPLEHGIDAVKAELNEAFAEKAEPEILDRFRAWIEQAQHKLDELAPPSAGAAPPVPGPGAPPPDMMAPPGPMPPGLPAGGPPPAPPAQGAPGLIM